MGAALSTTKFLLAALLIVAGTTTGQEIIDVIELKVENCLTCSKPITSDLDLEVCGTGPDRCCTIRRLSDLGLFLAGTTVEIEGRDLDDCRDFDLGADIDERSLEITVYNSGIGYVTLKNVLVISETRREFECEFDYELFGTNSEVEV